jgi:hypothetical protein
MIKICLIKNKFPKYKINQDIKSTDKNHNKMMEIKYKKDFKIINKVNFKTANFSKLI